MKKTYRFAAMLLALLVTITSFALLALAEGEGDTSVENGDSSAATEGSTPETGNTESSDPESGNESGNESSEPETSEPETSEPETSEPDPNAYTVNVTVQGVGADAVSVSFNGEVKADGYFGSAESLNVTVEPKYGFKITGASFGVSGFTQSLTESEGKYSGTYNSLSAGYTYTLSVTVELVPIPAKLSVTAFGATGYTVSVGGEVIDLNTKQLMTGDEVKVDFAIDGDFNPASANLTLNGAAQTVTEPSITFVISGNTDIVFLYGVVPVTITINGPGTITIQKTADSSPVDEIFNSNPNAPLVKTIYLSKDVNYKLFGTPASGYEASGAIEISEPRRDAVGNVYFFIPGGATTVSASFKASDKPPVSDCVVQINASMGGKVVAGSKTIFGGMSGSIILKSGESLTITVIPDEDYAVDVFRVGGVVTQLTNDQYTLSNVVASTTTVSVVFKNVAPPPSDDETIGVDDINWNAPDVVVDITDGKSVRREVFDKIATLSGAGKYVEFVSANGSFFIPYGGNIEGSATHVNLSVMPLISGETYNTINAAINAASGGAEYKAFYFNTGVVLPDGTLVSFNLGTGFANGSAVMLLYNSANSGFFTKENAQAPLPVSANGISGKYAYDNEGILICTKDIIGGHSITASVVNEGGSINPEGTISVNKGLSKTFYITAQEGYVIKQVLIDGILADVATDQRIFNYTFENVTADHTISVEFEAIDKAGDGEEDDGGFATIIVILIIALVAIAGAAALFIVKWRQEKF